MPQKILIVTPWFPNTPEDGRFNFILHSVEALRKAGNQLATLVTRPWTPSIFGFLKAEWRRPRMQRERFDPSLGIRVRHHLSFPRHSFQDAVWELYRNTVAPQMMRMAREISAQVIHVHSDVAAFAAIPVAKELGIPVVLTLHGINTDPRPLATPAKRARLRRILAGVDRVVLVGDPLRAYFAPLAGGDGNFRVVPNGFFLPPADPNPTAGKDEDTLRLISVANLQEGKGIDLNLQALALLDQRGLRNWRYSVVGGGIERPRLEAMADEYGLRDRVTFFGHLPHREALAKLAEADLFILPSYREAFGVAYLEAMAAGLLAIGVKGQGPEAFLRDGESGFLIPPRDREALAGKLEFAIGHREECRRMARRGREVVRDGFTWERHAEKLMAVYSEAVK